MPDLKGKPLTPREQEVATLTVKGKTQAEIAAALHMSPRTVEKHREVIYLKLGVKSIVELVLLCYSIDPDKTPPTFPHQARTISLMGWR